MHEIEQSGEFLVRILGPLLKSDWLLMENLLTSLAKSLLIPSGLKLAASAADAAFEKKIFGSIMKIFGSGILGLAVSKHYKKNIIIGDLHPLKKLSSNFKQKVTIKRGKYIKAGYPFRFIKSIIDDFNQEKEDLLISTSLFEKRKEVIFQNLFCQRSENEISHDIDILETFPSYKVKFRYFWQTRNNRSLFVLKDPAVHKANVIYKGACSCSEFFGGETKRNSEVVWREHYSTKKMSEVGDHLLLNPGHPVNIDKCS